MARKRPTTPIGAKISNEQYQILLRYLGGETTSDYIRRLIADDMRAHGIEWPEYRFVTIEERRGMKGLPWIKTKKS